MLYFTEDTALQYGDFLRLVRAIDVGPNVPCAVLTGRDGKPNLHYWPGAGEDANSFLARTTQGRRGAYYTPGSFSPHPDGKRQRLKRLAQGLRAFWLDIEGTEEKGGYAGLEACLPALERFIKLTGLVPTIVVLTGSGGMHAYFTLDHDLTREEWQGRAEALAQLAHRVELKFDAPITTDPARILRIPGSIHQKTGVTVKAYRTGPSYTLEELDQRLGYQPRAITAQRRTAATIGLTHPIKAAPGAVRGDAAPRHRAFSMVEVAEHCAAVRMAVADRGAATPYHPWVLALNMARLSVEGEDLGHAISQGHPDYNPMEVNRKMASFTGGPPSCQTWHRAWGEKSPCPSCLYGGIEK